MYISHDTINPSGASTKIGSTKRASTLHILLEKFCKGDCADRMNAGEFVKPEPIIRTLESVVRDKRW